ncbi:hypothetical protein AALP_AA8G453000 [Arabis alpina]|uniref:TPX2 central domain-containing protein n=1 Tax=Arabis alpina TaxID=50452 RepID=A0A087GDK4_ARAAL|nr:hypothetical protein AALP_AA8G453000 [Arabis alpina]
MGIMVPEYSTMGLSGDEFSFEEFDIDFEFDAPKFYDFSRPELDSETTEIEMWFESSGNYPPSPFSPKFKFEPFKEVTSTSSESKPIEISNTVVESSDTGLNQYNGFIYYNQKVKDVTKTKPKSKTKPISSTLTRPTASLLARQNKPLEDNYSLQLLTRCQRSLGKFVDNLSPILVSKLQNKDTKKQKQEAKVAQVNSNRRPKLTVPKEPNLKTAERSQRHRSKVNLETEQNAKSRIDSSKRNTTNKNISQEPASTSLHKSNVPWSKVFQAFRLRTSQRAKERSSNVNAKIDAIQENDATNFKTINSTDSSKSRIFKEKHSIKINCPMYEPKSGPLDSSQISSKEELSEAISNKYGIPSPCRTDMKPFLEINRNFDTNEVAGNLLIA